jgi:hypothetical protein
MPHHLLKSARVWKIMNIEYGHLRSVALDKPVTREGAPLPWYTYPAIDYLEQLDLSNKTVFEYGCGHSTLYWASRAAQVVSVEHNEEWYRLICSKLPSNCTLVLERESDAYAAAIDRFDQQFDVIVVDGLVKGRTRMKCTRAALPRLRDGGMIILDNADWLPESSRVLRQSDFIEVDMSGFAPINDYTHTTSFFLHRRFAFAPRHDRQPKPGIGARDYHWEPGLMAERLAAEASNHEPRTTAAR